MLTHRCCKRLLLLILPALTACTPPSPAPAPSSHFYGNPLLQMRDHSLIANGPSGPSLFIRGRARVVSVDPNMGHAVLEIEGKSVEAYWQTQWLAAQGGSSVQQDVNQAPVGIYRAPSATDSTFDAHPGDLIAFIGMQTGDSIFLQGITVISP